MIESSSTINLHPEVKQLREFVAGELAPGVSVAVSAHLAYCHACRERSTELEAELAAHWDESTAKVDACVDTSNIESMLDAIMQQPQSVEPDPPKDVCQEILINDKTISLPKVLATAIDGELAWRKLPGGISQAQVRIDDGTKCEFIYMSPGSKTPAHTHRGNEVMLVLDGTFSDEMGTYQPADFVNRDPSHHHQPQTKEGCLCFSVLDSPLVFTEGLLRLLNPFSRLMFLKTYWYR